MYDEQQPKPVEKEVRALGLPSSCVVWPLACCTLAKPRAAAAGARGWLRGTHPTLTKARCWV